MLETWRPFALFFASLPSPDVLKSFHPLRAGYPMPAAPHMLFPLRSAKNPPGAGLLQIELSNPLLLAKLRLILGPLSTHLFLFVCSPAQNIVQCRRRDAGRTDPKRPLAASPSRRCSASPLGVDAKRYACALPNPATLVFSSGYQPSRPSVRLQASAHALSCAHASGPGFRKLPFHAVGARPRQQG